MDHWRIELNSTKAQWIYPFLIFIARRSWPDTNRGFSSQLCFNWKNFHSVCLSLLFGCRVRAETLQVIVLAQFEHITQTTHRHEQLIYLFLLHHVSIGQIGEWMPVISSKCRTLIFLTVLIGMFWLNLFCNIMYRKIYLLFFMLFFFFFYQIT